MIFSRLRVPFDIQSGTDVRGGVSAAGNEPVV